MPSFRGLRKVRNYGIIVNVPDFLLLLYRSILVFIICILILLFVVICTLHFVILHFEQSCLTIVTPKDLLDLGFISATTSEDDCKYKGHHNCTQYTTYTTVNSTF